MLPSFCPFIFIYEKPQKVLWDLKKYCLYYKNIVTMQEQDSLFLQIDALEHLLSSPFPSPSRDKLNNTEKERTREESYEDIVTQIHQTKLEQQQLIQQLEELKRDTREKYLEDFQNEFELVNRQNQQLRAELMKVRHKGLDERSERYSNRSSIRVTGSMIGDGRTGKKPRNKASPNLLLKKQGKATESTVNLGRSQICSPKYHKRRESQLTERKLDSNCDFLPSFSNQLDYPMKQSLSKNELEQNDEHNERNIFVQMLEELLREEKNYEMQRYNELEQELEESKGRKMWNGEVKFINQAEQEIKITTEKLQMLGLVMQKYQSQIEAMNMNIRTVEGCTTQLMAVKGRFIKMQKHCEKLNYLRRLVCTKEQELAEAKAAQNPISEDKHLLSVEALIKIFLNNPTRTFSTKPGLYCDYYRELHEIFKFEKQQQVKRGTKIAKVREVIDGLREGRRKFNELIGIYEARITKLQDKIGRAVQRSARK